MARHHVFARTAVGVRRDLVQNCRESAEEEFAVELRGPEVAALPAEGVEGIDEGRLDDAVRRIAVEGAPVELESECPEERRERAATRRVLRCFPALCGQEEPSPLPPQQN